MAELERGGPQQFVALGLLCHWATRYAAYPDWPGGEVDMPGYIVKIHSAYESLGGFLDTGKVSYNQFATAVGSWATEDYRVDASIAMICQIGFCAVQWRDPSDEPSDAELADDLAKLMAANETS